MSNSIVYYNCQSTAFATNSSKKCVFVKFTLGDVDVVLRAHLVYLLNILSIKSDPNAPFQESTYQLFRNYILNHYSDSVRLLKVFNLLECYVFSGKQKNDDRNNSALIYKLVNTI